MMTQKVSKSSIKLSLFKLRRLVLALVFLFAAQGVWGETYYWVGKGTDNNWTTSKNWDTNPSGEGLPNVYPDSDDVVYIIDDSIINLTSATDFELGILRIANDDKTATLNLNLAADKKLYIRTINLGTESAHQIPETKGNLIISSSSNNTNVIISEFDTGNHGNNYLYLDNINCKVTRTFWVDSNGYATTIDGSDQSTFSHPSGSGGTSTITFGEEIVPEEIISDGGITVSTSGNPRPGAEITISINTPNTIYYQAAITGTELYCIEIDSNPIVTLDDSITEISSGEHNLKITFPTSIAQNNGLSFSLYTDSTAQTLFRNLIYYTQTLNETVWTGGSSTDTTDWNDPDNWSNGVPTDGMQVSIPQIAGDYYSVISSNTAENLVLTIAANASLTVGTGGALKTKSIRNNGTLAVSGGAVNSTTITNNENINLSTGSISSSTFTNNETITITGGSITASQKINSSASKIVYNATGEQTPVWGNNYHNLTVAAGTSIAFTNATTISGTATNNGTITIKTNNFNVSGSKTNGASSKIIYEGVNTAGWGNSYQNVEIKSDSSITFNTNTTVSGEIINNGSITFSGGTFTAGTKTNGTGSTIVYDGITSLVWGDSYKNLVINSGEITLNDISIAENFTNNSTVIIQGTTDVTGAATNNGSLTIKTNSFTPTSVINEDGSSVIYDGAISLVWGTEYKKLTINSGTLTLNGITVAESFTNDSTVIIQGATSLSGTATNNGTITFGAATLNGTPTFANGDTSTIKYDGTTSLIWGSDYKNLEVASGGLTLSADSTINASTITFDGSVSIPSNKLTLISPVININNDIETGDLTIAEGIVTITGNKTLTVNGRLSLGSAGNTTTVQSSSGTQWTLHCTGENNHNITNATIKDSNNISEHSSTSYNLIATSSTDGGNNTNWIFDGIEYVWQGGTTGHLNDWNTASNWNPASIPAAGSTIKIPKNKDYYPELSANLNLTYNSSYPGSITIEKDDAATNPNHGKLTISDGTLTVGIITNNGLVTFSGGSLSATTKANGTASTIVYNGTSTPAWSDSYENLEIAGGTLTLSSAIIVNNIIISSSGKLETTADITVTGNWTNNNSTDGFVATGGTVTFTGADVVLSGANKFNFLVIQDSIQITGNNEIASLTASNLDGKTITFNAGTTQTVNGKITLSGTANSDDNRLVLKSSSAGASWTIKCEQADNNHDIKFVELLDSAKVIQAGTTQYNLFASQSKDSGNNTNWSFPDMTYTWKGTASTSWNEKTNWDVGVVPTKGSTVKIDVSASGKYPSLLAPVDIKDTFNSQNYGTITVAANAEFDIAGQNLTAVSITNNGKVKLYGTQTIDAAMSNGDVDNSTSTIEYYYTDNTTSLGSLNWDIGSSGEKEYKNLIISRKVSLTEKLNVTGKITINADANLNNENNSITLVKLGDYNSDPKIQAGAVIIKTANAITLDDNAYAKSFDCYSAVNLKNISTTETQTYRDDVTLSKAETTLTAKNASSEYQTIDFKKDILVSGTGSKTLILAANTSLSNAAASIAPNVQTQTGTSFTASSNTTTFKADVAFADNSFNANDGTVILTGANLSEGQSSVSLSGANEFYKLKIQGPVTITGTNEITELLNVDSGALAINASLTLKDLLIANNANAKITTDSDITVTGNWTNNKAKDGDNYGFTATAGTITFTGENPSAGQTSVTLAGANKFNELKIQGPVTITGSNEITNLLNVDSGALAINASLTLKDLLIANNTNAKVTTDSDITVTGDWTNNKSTDGFTANGGTVYFTNKTGATETERKSYANLTGSNTFYNLSLNRCLNIHNDNIIKNNFTAIKPEQGAFGELKFANNSEQTVRGQVTFKGLGTGGGQRQSASCITENGTWKLKCEQTQNNHIIQYVNFKGCSNTSEYILIAKNSRDTGGNQHIVFLGLEYRWTGNTNNEWNDPSNWASQLDATGPVSVPEKGSTVIIQEGNDNYPILQENLDLKLSITEAATTTDYGTITIQAADETNVQGCLDLAGYDLTVTTITNNGLVRLIGASAQTITGKMINGAGSTVEYYTDTNVDPANFPWDGDGDSETPIAGKQYANLILNKVTSGSTVFTTTGDLTINEASTLEGNITIGTNESVSNLVINEEATLSGQLTITGTTTIATASGTVDLSNENNSFGSSVIVGTSNSSAADVTLKAKSTETITIDNNAYASSLTVQSPVELQNVTTTGNQTYNDTVKLKEDGDIILTAKNASSVLQTVYFKGDVSCSDNTARNLIIDAKTDVDCDSITTTGTQEYKGSVTLTNGAEITFTAKNASEQLQTLTFNDTVSGTTAGTKLKADANVVINTAAVTTTGNQTYNGTVTLKKDGGIILTAKNATEGLQTVFFKGNVSCSDTNTKNLIVDAKTNVDCASITTTGTQEYKAIITLNKNSKFETGTTASVTFGTDISGAGYKLIINTPNLISSIEAGDTSANITLATLELSSNTQIGSTNAAGINLNVSSITGTNKTLTFGGNTTLFTLKEEGITIAPAVENNKLIKCAGTATFNGAVTNKGTITYTNATTFKGAFTNTNGSLSGDTNNTLTFEKDYSGTGTSALTASKGQTIFYGNVDLSYTNFTHTSGTVYLKAPSGAGTTVVTLNTGSGKTFINLNLERLVQVSGTGTNTITNLVIKDSVELLCDNTIENFTADTPVDGTEGEGLDNKTITFAASKQQTINVLLKLKGKPNAVGDTNNHRLLLRSKTTDSPWIIKCTASSDSSHQIQNVDVKDSNNISNTSDDPETAYNLFAMDSWDSGNNTNWNFPGMLYKWRTNTTSTDWNTASNWEPASIPGKGAKVKIQAPSNNTYKYPVLSVALNLNEGASEGIIEVDSGATFDLAGQDLTVDTITNKGFVRLIGASGQTINGKMINVAGSTVEYYSGTNEDTATFPWDGDGDSETPIAGKQYANLIIKKAVTQSTSSGAQLIVSGTTTIAAGSGKTVTLNNSSNIFKGNVIVGNDVQAPATPVNAGTVTLNGTAGKDSENNDIAIFIQNNVLADSLTINSNIRGSTLSINAPLIINASSISSTGDQLYKGNVTVSTESNITSSGGNITVDNTGALAVNANTTITATNSEKKIELNGAVTGTAKLTTAGSGIANFNNTVNISSLETQKAIINTTSITTSGEQKYNDAVTLGVDDISLISNGNNITFVKTLDGAHKVTLSVPQNTTTPAATYAITVKGTVGSRATTTAAAPSITIAQAGDVSFKETVKINEFEIAKANKTIFGKAVDIGKFTDDTTHEGTITFGEGGKIADDVTFLTNNIVSITGTQESQMSIQAGSDYKNLTHQTGDTNIIGYLNAKEITLGTTSGTTTISGGLINGAKFETGTLKANGKIKTTGEQNYNGTVELTNLLELESTATSGNGITFASTIDGEKALSVKTKTGTSGTIFGNDVGSSAALTSLTVTGPSTINCSNIYASGIQSYSGAVTLTTTPTTHTLTAGEISFDSASQINGAANLIISTTDGTTFGANVGNGEGTALTSLEVTGKTTIDCTAIKTSGDQHYKNAVALTASPTLTSTSGNLTFDSTIDGEQLLTLNVPQNTTTPAATYTITVKGKVGETEIPSVEIAQAGNINFEDTVKTTNFTITKANDSTFDEQVDSSTFVITQADNTLFKKAVNVTGFTITTAATTTFNETVQISTFTDARTAGDITFKNSGTISTPTEFKTTGTVTFGDASADIMTFGSASPYESLTHFTGNTNITGILNAANITLAQTAGGPMTIANSGLFKTVDGEALTYTTSFTQNGTGNSVIGGSFTGNGNASFATNVQLYGSSQADFGSSGTAVSIAKNLIIIRAATDNLNINSNVNVTENLVLYKGPVVADANITVGKDILVLGSAYSLTDTSTGITNEYAYACVRPETWSQPNYVETQLPDGNAVPATDFTSTLSVSSGKTISAAKNFYANGTTLSTNGTTGQWTLKVPDLTNAANGFAEAYHSEISGCKVICSGDSSADGTKARLVCLECDDTATTNTPNTNVDFDDFVITAAWTERDNSIRVEFNRPVRYYDETVQTLKFQNASGTPTLNFTGLYSDPDCQNEIEYDTQMSYFYIKAAPQNDSQYGAWNTDATGRSSGADDDQSTDRSGIHHETIPALDFARALVNNGTTQSFIFTDRWGKRLNSYSSRTPTAKAAYGSTADTETTHEVADKTGPVLYSVRTGQELHDAYNPSTGQASEHSYDSHNFIEFVYSEKVDFDGSSDDTTLNDNPATAENVRVNDALGAIQGSITTEGSLSIAGLGIIQNGLLHTGKNGSTDKYVNALYRKDSNAEYSIRLSVAGYTDPSVTLTDDDGYTYKKWVGYIEQAKMPTGTVKHLVDTNKKNERVKDKEGNVQIKYADDITTHEPVFDTIPVINSTENGLYGAWDLSEPVFAIYRQNASTTPWNIQEFNKNYYAEAIGNNAGVGSTLDRIEFHLYDNTPQFDESGAAVTGTPEWFTEVGWCNLNSIGEKPQDLYKNYTYAADIFGGSRAFDSNASRRTSGGIRYSTIYSSVNAFKYGIGSALQDRLITTSFDNSKIGIPGASSLIFTGASSPRRSAGDSEGLYFALPLANTSLDIKTSFTVKYDDSVGFITDLAGNRLRSKTFSTIDRTPPSIDMTVCPVGGDELEIIFVKELCIDSSHLDFNDNSTGSQVTITEDYANLITQCIDFITIDSSGNYHKVTDLAIDQSVPARISIKENQNGSSFTSMIFKLSRTVTLQDIKTTFLRIVYVEKYGEYSVDLFTGHPGSRVTFIQDEIGNNIQMYTAHALSDFAVGVINPLYAYDSALTEDDGSIISDSLFRTNLTDDVDTQGWSVHDWNRNQQNYGTLPAKRPVAIVADTMDGTQTNENAPDSFRIYLSNSPDAGSVSTQYNKDLEPLVEWRIWLPNQTDSVFASLAEKNNRNYSQVDGTLLSADKSDRMIFELDESITNLWSAGNQISFLFGLTNSDGTPVTIMHSPELDINNDKQYLATSTKMPLFALRQTDAQDLMSLDLWSFRLKSNVAQRGGVTILNNVIDASVGEKAVVKVQVPEEGTLTVVVMTIDGNIVDYLHRGIASSGEHFYSWDGTNRKGTPVARGMYFIRVSGPGLDETRKVMVVKE